MARTALLLCALLAGASCAAASFNCTGIKRVCRGNEDPTVDACNENVLNTPTVRITPGNWGSVRQVTWQAQVLLMEQLQVPVEIIADKDGVPMGPNGMDIYRPPKALDGTPLDAYPYPATAFNLDYLRNGHHDAHCARVDGQCSNLYMEMWAGGRTAFLDGYAVGELENLGPLGVVGTQGLYIQQQTVETYPALAAYYGYKDATVTKVLRKPLNFKQWCAAGAPQDATTNHTRTWAQTYCSTMYGGTYVDAATVNAIAAPTACTAAERNPSTAKGCGIKDAQIALESAWAMTQAAMVTASGDLMVAGDFPTDPTSEDLCHVAFAPEDATNGGHWNLSPCSWVKVEPFFIYTHNLKVGYTTTGSYMTPFNAAVELGIPTVVYGWKPHALFNRYTVDGDKYKMVSMPLSPYSAECGKNRVSYADYCVTANFTNYNAVGACDHAADLLYKISSKSFSLHHPVAYDFARAMQVTETGQEELLGAEVYNVKYTITEGDATRDKKYKLQAMVICDWFKSADNEEAWKNWIPPNLRNTRRCRDDCSGTSHGSCTAHPALDPILQIGQCLCKPGYMGATCAELELPYLVYGHAAFAGGFAICLVFLVLTVAMLLWITKNRANPAVGARQFIFLVIQLMGCILACILPLIFGGEVTAGKCLIFPILANMAYTLVYGALLVKTYWLQKLFLRNKKMKALTRKAYLTTTLGGLTFFIMMDILLPLVFEAVQPAVPIEKVMLPVNSVVCDYHELSGTLLFAYKGFVLLILCVLAFVSRSITDKFGESKSIGMVAYNTMAVTMIVFPLMFVMPLGVAALFLIKCVYVAVLVAIVLIFMFIPIVMRVLHPERYVNEGTTTTGNTSRATEATAATTATEASTV